MKLSLSSFLVGFIFAIGLGLSGMTQPHKVIGFLDVTNWDPSLLYVMIGAIGIHAPFYWLILQKRSPLFAKEFQIPTKREITPALIIGSILQISQLQS